MSQRDSMASVKLPIAISLVADRYLLFSVDVISYLRREHNISGVLTGSLPQCPQQNVFLGIPLELMPEEARLLVDQGIAYIVDELRVQRKGLKQSHQLRTRYLQDLDEQVLQQRKLLVEAAQERKKRAVLKNPNIPTTDLSADELDSRQFYVTPVVSQFDPPATSDIIPDVPSSYPLYRLMHSRGYFMSPGLRFGCNYMAYPGDTLRFHSHFLCASLDSGEEVPLLDLVGGGRLATGVKKAYLLGGELKDEQGNAQMRTFCLEWAGM